MVKKYVVDTNFVYEGLQETFGQYDIVLMSTVRQELDKHKTAINPDLQFQARQANRFIFENHDKFTHDTGEYDSETILGREYSNEIKDNRIIACAKENGYGILTNDLNMYSTAKALGIDVISYTEVNTSMKKENLKGFKEIKVTPEELIEFHVVHLGDNIYNLRTNEYLLLTDTLGNQEVFVWTGKVHEAVKENLRFKSTHLGEYKPRDPYQRMAMDSIIRNDFTILKGIAGSSKTLSAISYAMQEIETGRRYDKLTVITNNVPAKNAFYNGLVKGSLLEKLMSSNVGNMLSSKLGDEYKVIELIETGQLEIIPLSDVRGWEAKAGSVVILSEAQNYDREGLKLALQRIPEGCKVIVEGDNDTQLDSRAYEGRNNGMTIASEVFSGEDYFGLVELQISYRSKIATRAELMSNW